MRHRPAPFRTADWGVRCYSTTPSDLLQHRAGVVFVQARHCSADVCSAMKLQTTADRLCSATSGGLIRSGIYAAFSIFGIYFRHSSYTLSLAELTLSDSQNSVVRGLPLCGVVTVDISKRDLCLNILQISLWRDFSSNRCR